MGLAVRKLATWPQGVNPGVGAAGADERDFLPGEALKASSRTC